MMATTTSPSMMSPMFPLVRLVHGVKTTSGVRITPIRMKPNQSSLRIFIARPPRA